MNDLFVTREVSPEAYNQVIEERSRYYSLLTHIVCTLDGEGPLEGVQEHEFDAIVFRIEQLQKRVRSSISVRSL
jgi:hypothetical protein